MKIGIDASRAFVDQPTGTERYSREMISHLLGLPQAGGHEWVLYVRKNQKVDSKLPEGLNVKICEIDMPRLWTQVGLAYRTWIDGLDVLWVPAHTLPVLRHPGLKTLVTIHGLEYEWLPEFENQLQRWYLPLSTIYAVRAADRVVAVSRFTKNQLVERLGADPDKIEVVWEGATRPTVKFSPEEQDKVLNRWGLAKGNYYLFVGTVQPRKNLERLIRAATSVNSEVKLVIAGKLGWKYEQVVELAERANVILTGYISDAERYILLQNARFYVQPSITEGFGLPVLEAWQSGLAVASSCGGALGEVVGGAGVVFDPTNEEQMVEALKKMLKNSSLRRKMEIEGKKRLKLFDWTQAAIKTYNIMQKLAPISKL